jgi:hypothetical protein
MKTLKSKMTLANLAALSFGGLQGEKGVFAPADQVLILAPVLVTRPFEEPLKILLMVKKISPISALPRLQEQQHWLDVINSNVLE